jgi:Holliday junction resolvasome RuvABC DNA-binding subunit
MNLGFQRPAAERALAQTAKNGDAESFDVLFRGALALITK